MWLCKEKWNDVYGFLTNNIGYLYLVCYGCGKLEEEYFMKRLMFCKYIRIGVLEICVLRF